MASEIKLENIVYESIEEVLDFPFHQETSCEFEIAQNYFQIPIVNELPQVFFIDENSQGNFVNFIKLDDQLIIEEEVLDTLNQMNNDQRFIGEKFYESNHDSSFEKVMKEVYQQKAKEEEIFDQEVVFKKILIDAIHEEQPPKIICGICQKQFVKQSYLLQHTNYKHTEKPFKCVKCHKKFANEDALENHMMRHENIYKPFKCDMVGCTKAYAYKSDLKIHHKNHVKELKSNVCECGKRFSRRDHLVKHKKTHVKKLMKQKNLMQMCGL